MADVAAVEADVALEHTDDGEEAGRGGLARTVVGGARRPGAKLRARRPNQVLRPGEPEQGDEERHEHAAHRRRRAVKRAKIARWRAPKKPRVSSDQPRGPGCSPRCTARVRVLTLAIPVSTSRFGVICE